MNVLNKRLKMLREENKMTKKEIAEYPKIVQTTYGKYELGKKEPNYKTLNKSANYFGALINYPLGRTNIRNPVNEIAKTVRNNSELLEFWQNTSSRDDLKIMFKQAKDLLPQDIKTILPIIRRFKNEQAASNLYTFIRRE
jgi:transcriptional regulator with XRE-family HTH domain